MSILVYQYPACSTCKKALAFLREQEIQFESRHIVDSPPSSRQLAQALKWRRADGGELKNLFNTSGELYREMKIADRLKAGLSESEALDLLAQHGKLIKRPLVLGADWALVGFREEVWTKHFDKIGSAKRG